MADYPIRPPTPQAMLHRLPDKPDEPQESTRPSKYIILIIASTSVAGKVQIAKSVAASLSCPLFQGDSLHETAAKAASVGSSRGATEGYDDEQGVGPNEARYRRMWLSKMTRTGLLFPEESRPAKEGFSGFGGSSSTSTSRRGSASSIASTSSFSDAATSTTSIAASIGSSATPTSKYINKPPAAALPEDEKLRMANPALMVVTHPELQQWHRDCIRKSVGEYGIGVVFVPLCEEKDDDLPVLQPLDPRMMTSFACLGSLRLVQSMTSDEETILRVNVDGKVEDIIDEIVDRARQIMGE